MTDITGHAIAQLGVSQEWRDYIPMLIFIVVAVLLWKLLYKKFRL